jgi:hypothetical protein
MVTEFGMSKTLGPLVFSARSLWGEGPDYRGYGERAARRIEECVRQVVSEAHRRARMIVEANRAVLETTARELRERETLGPEDLDRLFATVVPFEPRPVAEPDHARRTEPRRLVSAPWRRRRRDLPSPAASAVLASQRLAAQRPRRW